jgi:hypothetical protein
MSLTTNVTQGDPGHAGLHNEERAAINGKPDDFTDLGDTPASLAGGAGQFVRVNSTADGLEVGELVTGDDVEVTDALSGLILEDRDDGTRWRLFVNEGTLDIEEVGS